MLGVQEQHREHLVIEPAELQAQVVAHRLRAVEDRPLRQLRDDRAARQFEHGLQFGAFGRAQSLDGLQAGRVGLQQPADAAELRQQLAGELQHPRALEAGAQQQRQQFGVGQGCRPQGQEFFARAHGRWQVLHVGHPGCAPLRRN